MKYKTNKYIPPNNKKINKNKTKYLYNKILSNAMKPRESRNSIENLIVLRPNREHPNTKIINYISGIEHILQMNILKNKFKTFFTLDYMNYINLDINKRKSQFSTTFLTYNKHPIIFEGCLAIVISSGVLFDAYMLDTLKIITSENQQNNLYFPQDLPDILIKDNISLSTKLLKIYEIINQAYTIIKYIAIILAYQQLSIGIDNKNEHQKKKLNAFEIIKVRMHAYDDLSLILDECKIKKDWHNTLEDNKILYWLKTIFFNKVLSDVAISNNVIRNILKVRDSKGKKEIRKQIIPETGDMSKLSLYKLDLSNKQKINKLPGIYASNMTRKDFNNKFVIISSDFIKKDYTKVDVDFQEYIKYLKKYGLEFEEFYTTAGTKPAFIFYPYDAPANSHLITQHYNTPAYCSNMLDSLDNINNKSNLFFYLKKLYPNDYKNFIADSFHLTQSTKYIPGKIYIARPINQIDPKTGKILVSAFSGRDIIYITNPETLTKAKQLLSKYDNVLISDYISNPLLFKGLKFHLRVYLIITYINSEVKTHFFPDSYIWTASKPFVLDKFYDKEIHDTHYSSTDDDYLFSSDFNTENMGCKITKEIKNKLLDDMQAIMDKISKVLVYGNTGVKLFYNHKNAFQIEGIDIMINDKMQPILIECNSKAGVSDRPGKGIEMQKRLIAFINKHALEPIFGSKS